MLEDLEILSYREETGKKAMDDLVGWAVRELTKLAKRRIEG